MKIQGHDVFLEKCVSNLGFEKLIGMMYGIFSFADEVDAWSGAARAWPKVILQNPFAINRSARLPVR